MEAKSFENKEHTLIDHPFIKILDDEFNNAVSKEYYDYLKDRIITNEEISTTSFEERWEELKRFFLIKRVSKKLSMFSPEIDELWHEMIMDTYEYNEFCKSFGGKFIHHEPHKPGTIDYISRAWFDFFYIHMFKLEKVSWQYWHGFLHSALSQESVIKLKEQGELKVYLELLNIELLEKYPESESYFKLLVNKL